MDCWTPDTVGTTLDPVCIKLRRNQLAIIRIFIALFLAIIRSASVAISFESPSATAAWVIRPPEDIVDHTTRYSAVLIEFMQIVPQTTIMR